MSRPYDLDFYITARQGNLTEWQVRLDWQSTAVEVLQAFTALLVGVGFTRQTLEDAILELADDYADYDDAHGKAPWHEESVRGEA